jgi:hypothetical protein
VSDTSALAILQQLGLDKYLPVLFAFHTLCSFIDAIVPQPAPGSFWLPFRKVLSILALNVAWASNAKQPPLITWMMRAGMVLQGAAEAQQSRATALGQPTEDMQFQRPVLIKPQSPPPSVVPPQP